MTSRYHKSTCGYDLAEWTSLKGGALRFDVSATYGTKFELNSEDFDDGENFTFVPCPAASFKLPCQRACHDDSIIVAVSSRCRASGSEDARSTCGVYFSRRSLHNGGYWIAGENSEHTKKKADLHACIEAMRTVKRIIESSRRNLYQVIVKTDSEYLYRCMTEYLVVWKFNGFRASTGHLVENWELLQEIDQQVQSLKRKDNINVFLWLVPKEQNLQAHELANQALDGAADGATDGAAGGEIEDGFKNNGVANDGNEDGTDDGVTFDDGTDDGTDDGDDINYGSDRGTDDGGIPTHRLDRRGRNNSEMSDHGDDEGTDEEDILRQLSNRRGISP